MLTGMIFDIREFAIHDGPGIRTTVFMKGCPLRCNWCHNPEGISSQPQVLQSPSGDRLVGKSYTSQALSTLLNRQAEILRMNDGGVTFSGGEPLQQAPFIAEVIEQLANVHVTLDTSGFGDEASFSLLASRSQLVYFDLKLVDPAAHRRYTGQDNALILRNLQHLGDMDTPFVIRVPLVPGVTDSRENLAGIAHVVTGLARHPEVHLLPYNRAAGGKYSAAGMEFCPQYNETQPVQTDLSLFADAGIKAVLK